LRLRQDYAEIDSFVWKERKEGDAETTSLTVTPKMSPKASFSEFGNLIVTISPNFVRNIECVTNCGQLVSILQPKQQEHHHHQQQQQKPLTFDQNECYIVQQVNNDDFNAINLQIKIYKEKVF
jgi:hypothetical protein